MPPHPQLRIALVEDDERTRAYLAALVAGSPGLACVGRYANAEIALRQIPTDQPHVLLVDLALPGLGGVDLIRSLRARESCPELLVLTIHDEAEYLFPALAAGASGYLIKGTPPARIVEAIAEVHAGQSPMSGAVARKVVEVFQRPAPDATHAEPLTTREHEVLALLARGAARKQIAAELDISEGTVNAHVFHIYRKLHVHAATAAVAKYLGDQAQVGARLPPSRS